MPMALASETRLVLNVPLLIEWARKRTDEERQINDEPEFRMGHREHLPAEESKALILGTKNEITNSDTHS